MLHTKTIEPNTLELLKSLMQKHYLKQFVLVGGTALALHIGHRQSVDIDLFTIEDFNTNELLPLLIKDYNLSLVNQTPQSLICTINNVKVDFIRFQYPFIRPISEIDGVRIISTEDIAAMKLDAIVGRGRKKDFYDIYYLLKQINIEKLLELYQEKYPHQTTFHVLRSLVYFADADPDPDPIVFDNKLTWHNIKNSLIKEIQKIK